MADEKGITPPKLKTLEFGEAVGKALEPSVSLSTLGFDEGMRGQGAAQMRPGFIARAPFEVRNAVVGVPFDTQTELPFHIRLGAAARTDQTEKKRWLNEQFGNDFTRFADNGSPIVRVLDPQTGQAKDILVNTEGITMGDLAEFSAMIPEFLGGIAGQKALSKIPGLAQAKGGLAVLRGIFGEGVGSETAGLAKDVAMSDQVPFVKLAETRAKMLPGDLALGLGLAGAAKVASKIVTPLGYGRGPVQQELREGQKILNEAYGEVVPTTPGELTQNPLLLRAESTMSRLPGSAGTFRQILNEKTKVFARVMNRLMGLPAEADDLARAARPTATDVGEEAIGALRQELNALKTDATASQARALDEIQSEIYDEIATATRPGRRLHASTVGKAVRASAKAKRMKFERESEVLYEEALSKPGGRDRILKVPELPQAAKGAISELASVKTTVEEAGEILDEFGKPNIITRQEVQPVKEFLPPDILPRLNRMASFKPDDQFSLADLKQMRTDVDNAIKVGEAIPGVQTHELGKLRKLLTSTMEKAADSSPDPQLKSAWQRANKFYAENVGQFKEKNISQLFKDIEQAGFVDDADIVKKVILGGPDTYKRFRQFLGPDSQVFKLLKRGIADNMYLDSLRPGSTILDGQKFLEHLTKLENYNPEIFKDMFPGQSGLGLKNLATIMERTGGALDASAVQSIIDNPGSLKRSLVGALDDFAKKQAKLDRLYRVEQLKKIADGTFGQTHIDEANFVRTMWKDLSLRDVEKISGLLANKPDTLWRLQNKVVEDMLFEAQKVASVSDPSRLGTGAMFRQPSNSSLERVIGTEDNKRKLQQLLGMNTYKNLDAFAKVLRAGEASEAAFASAGGIQASAQIAGAMRRGPLVYLADWAKQKVISVLITHEGLQKIWPVNAVFTPERMPAFYSALFASEPMLEAFVEAYGEQEASALMGEIRKTLWKSTDQMLGVVGTELNRNQAPVEQLPGAVAPMTPQQMALPTNETRKVQGQTPQGALTP